MKIWKMGALALMLLLIFQQVGEARNFRQSKHNLSASGPGAVKATVEKPMCDFCHSPHRSGQALPVWNRDLPGVTYITYQSSSLKAAVGQPNGTSKLCLSCHDGTIALGALKSEGRVIPFSGGAGMMPPGRTNLGIDLSDDHPVSFVYDSALAIRNGQLEQPSILRRSVKLDRFGQVQCTTCHDPHDDQYGKFLVMDNSFSALCTTCHKKTGWSMASHRSSNKTWNRGTPNPWPHTPHTTVSANACENCHRPHTAGGRERLLNYAVEEENCFPCHNGNVASKNVKREFDKPYRHPVENTKGIHKPTEDPLWAPRHVECEDCHNPHASNATPAAVPNASGRLAGVVGISASGTAVNPLVYEYELCFRCHGDNPGTTPPVVVRWIYDKNLRNRFATSNASFHPVLAPGKNPDGPSLILPWIASSLLYGTDCHNSDSGVKAGGVGPNGAHGSLYRPILISNQAYTDNTMESAAAYALCYRCHNRNSILTDQSFKKHRLHIVDKQTPCTACHDPHGVATNTHLINFDKAIVFPNSKGIIRFEDRGRFAGACSLNCHNVDHDAKNYS
jgi:predicted CXXCH cytochrome family protein